MLWQKLLVLILIASGETGIIVAQIFGAKKSLMGASFWEAIKPNQWYMWLSILGTLLILIGYFYGITIFKNIWLVTITSWTALVIAEVGLSWLVFRTIPQGSVLLGLILVLVGFSLASLKN